MPLEKEVRERILDYCDRHLPIDNSDMFDFIEDEKLKRIILDEFSAARYIYKLGEALKATESRLHAHVKFQIVQYAGIYEAVIVYVLWSKFKGHPAVTEIENHLAYSVVGSFPKNIKLTTLNGDDVVLCKKTNQKTSRVSIKFDDKVDAAVKIGFIDDQIADEIKNFYKLRNAIHLDSALKNNSKYELENSLLAYRRLLPFTRGIRGFLATGRLPKTARPRARKIPKP